MNLTEKILATVKSNHGITSVEVYNQLDEAQGKNDVSSILASLYKYGRVTREPAIINKRHAFTYTWKSDTASKQPPKAVEPKKAQDNPKKPSRIDIIGQNGNDGDHYNEMPPADPVLLAMANRELNSQLEKWKEVASQIGCNTPLELRDYVERLQRESIKGVTCVTPIKQPAPPLFWLAIANGAPHSEACITEADARHEAEILALQEGEAYVCAVLAECKTVVKWKEAA